MARKLKPKKFKPSKKSIFSGKALLFVLAFAIIGTIALIISNAASSSTVEPEEGTQSGGATVVSDSTASGGQAVRFASPVTNPPVSLPSPGTWTNATGTLANLPSECGNLTMLSAVPGTNKIVAGVARRGLWASTNSGATWTQMPGSTIIPNRAMTIIYDPNNSNIFWEVGIYNGQGVFKTTDGGATFTRLGTVEHNDFLSIDFTDSNRQTLLAGGHEQTRTLYKSTNGGSSWTNIGANLPAGTATSGTPMVFGPQTYVINLTDNRYGTVGQYRTTDGGTTWTRTSTVETRGLPLVTANGTIYLQIGQFNSDRLLKSSNQGATWTEVGSGLTGVTPIELPDGRIVSASSTNLLVSSDGGVSWTSFGAQLPYTPANIMYSPSEGAFYISRWDCGNVVLPNAIMRLR